MKSEKCLLLFILFTFSILMCGMKSEAATLYWPVPGHTSLSQGHHNGNAIDISDGSIAGANVVAAMGGKVTHIYLCGTQHLGQTCSCNGFGTGLVIAGDDGRIYQYAHMQANSIPSNVYYGAYVSAGQQIGRVGTTGNSSGNHLHFGISLGNYWNASGINPINETYQGKTVHTHSYSSTVTKNPACTATGVRTYKCSCGASYTETIAAKGHSYSKQTVAPTLTEKGYTLYKCSSCGYSYKDNYVNPPELSSDGWYYCNTIPSGLTTDKYKIEYNNYYEKIQASSPGADWTKAATVKDVWQNSGGQYTSESDLATSDSRILVRSVYYHFCGPNAGAAGNYDQSGSFVHYDEIAATSVIPTYCGVDNGHPYYVLDWNDGGGRVWCKSGVTCDGAYGTHGARCKAWYKMNTYQDRVRIVQYKYTKNSGWVNAKDSSAASVKIRFKSVETNSEVTVTFNPNGGSVSTKSKMTSGNKISTLPTPTRKDYKFLGWYDSAGQKISTSTQFTSNATVTAEWQALLVSMQVFKGKTVYYVDDELDTDDFKIKLNYADGTSKEYSLRKMDFSDVDMSYAHVERLGFTYEEDGVEVAGYVEVTIKQRGTEDSSDSDEEDFDEEYDDSHEEDIDDEAFEEEEELSTEEQKAPVKKPKVSKVKGLKAKAVRKGFSLTWKKVSGAQGYQIKVATKKNFKNAKTYTIKKNKAKYKVTKLKAKKKYYIQIRAYKTYKDENGNVKKVYGKYTSISKKTK